MSADRGASRLVALVRTRGRAAFVFGLPAATAIVALVVGTAVDVGAAILVLAGGALIGTVAILWESVRALGGEAPIAVEDAIALGAPTAAEEQKRAVLQAIKDLEYERAVGKIDEADYRDLLGKYRAEAKRILRALDDDIAPLRPRAEALVAERLGTAKAGGAKSDDGARCPSCGTRNDSDAVYCKACGKRTRGGAAGADGKGADAPA